MKPLIIRVVIQFAQYFEEENKYYRWVMYWLLAENFNLLN